jgi:CRISPR type I-E-associated protein CasA/Cse1
MSVPVDPLSFNALTSRWIPLVQSSAGGAATETVWASPVEVLCGEIDGVDLDWPRDDFRVYGRLLLSALVQALFPARDKAELQLRLDRPLSRAEVDARVEEVRGDFDLFGPTPFLQVVPPAGAKDKGAAPFVFQTGDLSLPQLAIDAVGLPTALVTLFVEHTYAGGAGRGYAAGPGGQPGVMTLIDPGSVRACAWANSLTLDVVARRYANDGPRPWSNEKRAERPRAATGLVEGLFFQPRAIWLVPCASGPCSFTGVEGPRVKLSPFLAKSLLTSKPTKGEDIWQHPCAPMAVNSVGLGVIRLNAAQPMWTGLAQVLAPLSKKGAKIEHPRQGVALVLDQWKTLRGQTKRPRLLVLDFDRDKANIKQRFFEAWPLTEDLVSNRDLIERLRDLAADAEFVEKTLWRALLAAHDERTKGARPGLSSADAITAFWMQTETPFLAWLHAASVQGADEQRDAIAEREALTMREALRRVAVRIFDEHCTLSEFDPRKQELVARSRSRLRRTLWPPPKTDQPRTPRSTQEEQVR